MVINLKHVFKIFTLYECTRMYNFNEQDFLWIFLQINFPLCTIAHTPRLPEHCIEYVRILLWPKEEPFGGK